MQESTGDCTRSRQNLISLETLEATDICHMAHLNGSQDLPYSLVGRAQTLLRRNKEQSSGILQTNLKTIF